MPWTRHLLAALWEQVRLLLQVIYCTFISVFQMFRFEVHLRITDESGQHIQHMDPPNSFLFSSLFDGDGGVMVGGSHTDGAEALLSSLRGEELCRGLVDDLVSRTSGKESGWKVDFHGDWSLFSSSGDSSPQWSSEDDQNQAELDGEESRALWESLSSCSDPYNPLFFSASFSTGSRTVEAEPSKVLVSRSDSEVSWSGSDSSGLSEESEKLLELFSSADPYNPMCFTASISPAAETRAQITAGSKTLRPCADEEEEEDEDEEEEVVKKEEDDEDEEEVNEEDEEEEVNEEEEEDEDEEEENWNTLRFRSAPPANNTFDDSAHNQRGNPRGRKPRLSKTKPQHHSHPNQTWVPGKKPGAAPATERRRSNTGSAHKQVRFSSIVQVHVMRSWSFARQAARRGPWEEMARDRERFRRRIQEAERSIGPCLSSTHRTRIQAYQDTPSKAADTFLL